MDNKIKELHENIAIATGRNITTDQSTQTDQLTEIINRVNQLTSGIVNIEQGLFGMSVDVSVCKAQVNMLQKIIIENGIMTEEELKEKYQKEVANPIQQQLQNIDNSQK